MACAFIVNLERRESPTPDSPTLTDAPEEQDGLDPVSEAIPAKKTLRFDTPTRAEPDLTPPTNPRSRETILERRRRVMEDMAARFEREPPWRGAAGTAQAALDQQVAQLDLDDASWIQASCRGSMCRVLADLPDEARREEDAEALLTLLPGDGRAEMFHDLDDPSRVVLYAWPEAAVVHEP
jgi:hypothetical protein